MHPMGLVLVDGYSRFLPYYKSLLDKLYVDYNVWTVGEYKSFVEPITRDDMSPQDEEATRVFLDALWSAYQADVTTARGLAAPALQQYADDIVTLLGEAGGDTARLAVDYGLVDELLTRDAMRERIREAIGEEQRPAGQPDVYTRSLARYVRDVAADRSGPGGRSRTRSPSSWRRARFSTALNRRARSAAIRRPSSFGRREPTAAVKALVLRVDSGGGSAFASDVILRELERFQETDRPVVVSMGSVAASGGYWISMAADEIWASPTTLTGSIGVGATIPTIPRTLDWLGVHVDGVGTTELAGALDITRPLGENMKGLLDLSDPSHLRRFRRQGRASTASAPSTRSRRPRKAASGPAPMRSIAASSTSSAAFRTRSSRPRSSPGSRAAPTCSITSSRSSALRSACCCR